MKTNYLSRSFVEFGPLLDSELAALYKRGALQPGDYIRPGDSADWQPVDEWIAALPPEKQEAKPKAKPKAAAKAKAAPAPAAEAAPAPKKKRAAAKSAGENS